jgi:NurA-like 5'-3' nuclease
LERRQTNMMETDSNHYRIVAESLAGHRPVDEQTLAALSILEEKLERLKKLDSAFYEVAFSTDVEKLRKHRKAVAVG